MRKLQIAVAGVVALAAGLQVARTAHGACCYFAAKDKDILQPGQKAFITWEPARKLEAFTVQPKFEGNAMDFGMVIPTPARPKLDEMPRDFFKDLAIYTILMPLPEAIYTPGDPAKPVRRFAYRGAAMGGGIGMLADRREVEKHVRVLESGVVGSLDYKVILADDAKALFDWLKEHNYSYSGDEATLNYYIQKKSFFTVMKIDSKQMKKAADGSYTGEVTPTRFTFTSNECMYPLKITQISVKDKTDALFYVQAPAQMDLKEPWSWMPSYRVMYLTYMLGCSANPQEQQELEARNQWLSQQHRKDPRFETTKLEWAKKLGGPEIAVLEDPQKNYAQMGVGDLPAGSKVISLQKFLENVRAEFVTRDKQLTDSDKQELARMEDTYQPAKGSIVENDLAKIRANPFGFNNTHYSFYPARTAPLDDIKGLARLKGQLRSRMWLTKFRKQIRKDEMNGDLVLSAVPTQSEQTYVRIMPTSPP